MKQHMLNEEPETLALVTDIADIIEALQIAEDWNVFVQEPAEPISDTFLWRCDRAADLAIALARLCAERSKERENLGFGAVALSQYLPSLATAAGVSLTAVLAYFQIPSLIVLEVEMLPNLARLGQALGISLREMLIHLHLDWLEHFGAPQPILLPARRRALGPSRDPLTACEARLAQTAQRLSPPAQADMSRLAAAFEAAWENTPPGV